MNWPNLFFLRHSFDSVNTIYTLQNYYYAQTSFIDLRQQWDGKILLVAMMFKIKMNILEHDHDDIKDDLLQ